MSDQVGNQNVGFLMMRLICDSSVPEDKETLLTLIKLLIYSHWFGFNIRQGIFNFHKIELNYTLGTCSAYRVYIAFGLLIFFGLFV